MTFLAKSVTSSYCVKICLQTLICVQTFYTKSNGTAMARMVEMIIWNQSKHSFQHIVKTEISFSGVKFNEKMFALYHADKLIELFLNATLQSSQRFM